MTQHYLIVGLGNPGADYELTRHNLGFLVAQYIAETNGLKFSASSVTKAMMAEGKIEGEDVTLLLPLTYMNKSGIAVKQYIKSQDVDLTKVLIVTDDVNLDFGQIRIRTKGSDGGHNGLSSVIEHLGRDDFARLRLGVGQPKSKDDMVDFVLEEFSKEEKDQLQEFVQVAGDCCLAWLKGGVDQAMNQFNRRKEDG